MNNQLTKREFFASQILSGMLAFSHEHNVPNTQNVVGSVHLSVEAADWLIEHLAKIEPKSPPTKSPDLEHFDKMRLNEVTQKLDKIWGKVPNNAHENDLENAWTVSKAKEETKKLLTEYFL